MPRHLDAKSKTSIVCFVIEKPLSTKRTNFFPMIATFGN